jgi:hypothetical protein
MEKREPSEIADALWIKLRRVMPVGLEAFNFAIFIPPLQRLTAF